LIKRPGGLVVTSTTERVGVPVGAGNRCGSRCTLIDMVQPAAREGACVGCPQRIGVVGNRLWEIRGIADPRRVGPCGRSGHPGRPSRLLVGCLWTGRRDQYALDREPFGCGPNALNPKTVRDLGDRLVDPGDTSLCGSGRPAAEGTRPSRPPDACARSGAPATAYLTSYLTLKRISPVRSGSRRKAAAVTPSQTAGRGASRSGHRACEPNPVD
jgi:hypothetical protein